MTRGRQLSGHALGRDAVPDPGCPDCARRYGHRNYTAKPGHGRCSCGALSPHCLTQRERQDWHRKHKDEVRALLVIDYLRGTQQ